jgi:putative FmdB family regulatory protein
VPTYQYACTECGHGFEAVQSFSDDALTACPQCGGRLRKVFSSVGIVFKGSGFYRNDSREKAASGAAKSDDKAGSASDDKAGAKADLKPDAKPSGGRTDSATSTTTKSSGDASTASSTSGGGSGSKPSRSSTEGSAA